MSTKAICEFSGAFVCGLVEGKPKADACKAGAEGKFCFHQMSGILRSCGSDADCKKKPCCSLGKKMFTDMCDDADTAKLEAQVTALKASGQCAESDCYSAGSAMSAGAPSDSLPYTPTRIDVFSQSLP